MILTALPWGPSLPFEADDPVSVAAAWSSIAEPGDPAVRRLQELVGNVRALEWIFDPTGTLLEEMRDGAEGSGGGQDSRPIPWQKCHRRWHPRAAEMNLEESIRIIGRLGGQLIFPAHPLWPKSLQILESREPVALWITGEGDPAQLNARSAAIVGARASTAYGNRVAEGFSSALTSGGTPIVSGGAYGIDAAAHRGAIEAARSSGQNSGIAVLCGGLGNPYPAGNDTLFRRLQERGLLISESPPTWRPARWRFLERNRVIAALAAATVVVEAGPRSGAIATANRANDLGRPVGAVPGPVTSTSSAGCHELIRDGAELITRADDVTDLIAGLPIGSSGGQRSAEPRHLSPEARIVWSAFPVSNAARPDDLALAGGLAVSEVEVALLELQLRGLAERHAGMWRRSQVG